MDSKTQTLRDLFHVTFAIFTFWIFSIEHFLRTVPDAQLEKTILPWSALLFLYVIAYIIFINKKNLPKWNISKCETTLQLNLGALGLTLLILANTAVFAKWTISIGTILTIFFVLLCFIAFFIPIALFVFLFWKSR